jgi:hypothetical protein
MELSPADASLSTTPYAAGAFHLRASNDGATLFLTITSQDRDGSDQLLGTSGRGIVVWLDQTFSKEKSMGVRVLPSDPTSDVPVAVSPTPWVEAHSQVEAATAGLFAELPARERGIEAWRGIDGKTAILRLIIPPPVAALANRTSLSLGLEPTEKPPRQEPQVDEPSTSPARRGRGRGRPRRAAWNTLWGPSSRDLWVEVILARPPTP